MIQSYKQSERERLNYPDAPPCAVETPKLELIENGIRNSITHLNETLEMLGVTADRVFGVTLGNTPTDRGLVEKVNETGLARINDALRRLDSMVEAVATQARRFTAL